MEELNLVRQKNGKDKDIGKTLASDRFPNTMDSFWFSINPDIIISPFDFVTVRHIFNTRTVGMIKELKATEGIGTAARVAVMANTGIENDSVKTISIAMPVGAAKPVRFATQKEVIFALGIPEMQNPIPAGIIEMTNGLQVPVSLDISYLLGPDTAHVNAAGISGNLKTSYLFFLLQSAYQRLVKDIQEDVAIIIFNTKEKDLLHIDKSKKANKKTKKLFDLLEFRGYPQEVVAHKSTLLRFLSHVQRFRKSPMFIDKKVTSRYLGKEIKKIRRSDIFVIDISMIPTLQEQGFVVGDVMKSIDELYSSRQSGKRPKYILIFVDEINRFIPRPARDISAVAEQVMRTIVAGRSRGTILFSAQQFKSTVDSALHENTGMHIIAKLGMSELSTPPYLMIDESTKANIVRLNKGELVMVHPAFRQPIKIVFPKAPFKTG